MNKIAFLAIYIIISYPHFRNLDVTCTTESILFYYVIIIKNNKVEWNGGRFSFDS